MAADDLISRKVIPSEGCSLACWPYLEWVVKELLEVELKLRELS